MILDSYLIDVAERYESHAFLKAATQGCYIRMIKSLVRIYKQKGIPINQVRVLDWGSGKGHISYLLRNFGFNVVSCDIKSDAGDSSFGQAAPIILEKSIDVIPLTHPWILPFSKHEFDLVVSFGVLEHVSSDIESLKEINRILKPGGVFFFSFLPYWLSWTQRLAHVMGNFYHPRLYGKRQIMRLGRLSNFNVEQVCHGQFFPKKLYAP
jgi:SAM-dependent methyltransferase